ncbi:hypothetical protein HBH98_012010 [Parastagonospora nodorum]|nr:hypothetical protein HBH50_109610 [Parastagonospora nodorum]KAH4088230.1 hypothetical protein HBH48_126580 [Parastagonospora nodorum]KAH4353888.1 hypothetical protein HBH98_012010 [Parastagonospora nodorum]KAH4397416.1 hypothetical protein HBH97_002920 [Parastagonospora nodorum]KAH4429430.1 hypothetical protein HBH99_012070 [Parastagonospora nodorum]
MLPGTQSRITEETPLGLEMIYTPNGSSHDDQLPYSWKLLPTSSVYVVSPSQ